MKRHIVTRTERNILSALRRWNPKAPDEILRAEARQRCSIMVLTASERHETQADIALRLGYSVSQVERIIRQAKQIRADGTISGLRAWEFQAAAAEPAPSPEAGIEVPEAEPTVAELKARSKALLEEREDTADDEPKAKRMDPGEDEDDDGPSPVYAVVPHTHYRVRWRLEFIVVDHMHWLKPGDQVSFITPGIFGL